MVALVDTHTKDNEIQQEQLPKMGQFSHPHGEDDTTHNYTHDLYMFNHLNPLTITHQKVKP
jgi:hypothetical protein